MPGDGDQQPRPGPRKRPSERPGAPAQQRSGDAARPGAPRTRPPSRPEGSPERPGGDGSDRPRTQAPAKKAPAKKAPAKKARAKKAPAKKAPAKKAPAKKAPAKRAAAGTPVGEAPAKKAPAKKAPAKKAPAKKAPAKKAPAKKAPAKKAPAKKAPAKKAPATRAPVKKAPAEDAPAGGPALHDWEAAEDEWGPLGRDPGADDPNATRAVPAAELLERRSPSVVVSGVPADEPLGFDDLADAAPLLAPEEEPAVEPPPDGPPPGERPRKPKKLRGKAKRIQKAKARPPSRLLNHYDVNGPRIRLGFLWFVGLLVAIGADTATDLPVLAAVYATGAGFAGWQAARQWRKEEGAGAVTWAAAAIGAGVGLAGSQDPKTVGIVVLLAVPVAAFGVVMDDLARDDLAGSFGLTLQSGLFVGVAAASVPLVWNLEPSAAISLILLVSAYEVGDYIVGSGSLNAFEGPIAGMLAVAAVLLPLYAVSLPPIDADTVVTYGVIVAVCCPLGQIAASAVLPWSDSPAPAVRRLDSLIVTGPVWLGALALQLGAI